MAPEEFIKKYLQAAEAVEKAYGVPALLTLAQAALESGWGSHAPGNNFFGIKGPGQKKETTENIDGKDVKVTANFKVYNSALESFEDYAQLLKKRWSKALDLKVPEKIIWSIQNQSRWHYATDPYYVSKIEKILLKIKKILERKPVMADNTNELKIIARGANAQPAKAILNFEPETVELPEQPGIEFGTEHLHKTVVFGVETGNALVKTFEDGKVTVTDAAYYIKPAMAVPGVISGLKFVPAEIDNLDEAELQAEIDYVKANFDADDAKAKKIIVASIKAAYANYELVKAIKS